jgi:hypothetical protein
MLKAGFNLISQRRDYFTIDELKAFVADKIPATDQVWSSVKILFDTNKDGKIELSELVEGLRLKYD